MKSSFNPLLGFLTILLLAGIQPLQAQQADDADKQKKIVIIKKYVDEDGTEVIEKIVKDGDNMEIITEDIEGMDINMNVEVQDENGERVIKLRRSKGDGEPEVFEWRGSGDMPEEVRKKMEEMGIEMHHDKAKHHYRFDSHSGSGKAFLGVILSKKVTNEDGVETVEGQSDKGVVIGEVVEGSAAAESGLKDGDIMTAIDGTPIHSFDELKKALSDKKPGDQIQIQYLRDNAPAATQATLKEKAHKKKHGMRFFHDNHDMDWVERPCVFIGVYINSNSANAADGGAYVSGIIDDTPASVSGLSKGDVITALNGVSVNSHRELLTERNKHNPGDKVSLSYLRDGQNNTTDITFRECDDQPQKQHIMKWFDDESQSFSFDFDDDFIFHSDDGDTENKIIIIKKKKGENGEIVEEKIQLDEAPEAPELDIPAQDLELEDFNAYPNPSDGEVNIRFNAEALPTVIRIVDISGKEVYREVINDFSGTYNKRVNVNSAINGALFLSITQGEKVFTKKIVLSRA